MTMQRRHFELIAETLRALRRLSWMTSDHHAEIARAFSFDLAMTNPNFNRARFLRACGVEE